MKTRHKHAKSAKPRPHNPDKLPAKAVNPPVKKYRLLDRDEIKPGRPVTRYIEAFCFGVWDNSFWSGCDKWRTYRTTLTRAALARLR